MDTHKDPGQDGFVAHALACDDCRAKLSAWVPDPECPACAASKRGRCRKCSIEDWRTR